MGIILNDQQKQVVYYGFRPLDSLGFHESFSKASSYAFELPSRSVYMLIDIMRQYLSRKQATARPIGMVKEEAFVFDSCFESGNLDLVVKVKEREYDLYMRSDSNTRGHHQWFYFSVKSEAKGTVRFNIVNFTKRSSLYTQGMRVAIYSAKKAERAGKGELSKLYGGWHRGGDNIVYKLSKLTHELYQKARIT